MQATILSRSDGKFMLFAETEDNSDSCCSQLFQLQTIKARYMWTTWLGDFSIFYVPINFMSENMVPADWYSHLSCVAQPSCPHVPCFDCL